MEEEQGQLFWLQKPKKEKDWLIYYGGHPSGTLYIYEFKEALPARELEKIIQGHDRQFCIYPLGQYKTYFSASEWELEKSLENE